MAHPEDHGGTPFARPDRTGGHLPAQPQPPRIPGPFEIMVRTSAVWGLLAAVIVFVVFAFVPLVHPFSGAAGAFVATFCIVLGQRFTGPRSR